MNDALWLFNSLYEEYYHRVLGYFAKDFIREDAEDMTQQVFMKLWAWLPNGDYVVKNKKALIFKIAKNIKLDRFKSSRYLLETAMPEDFDIAANDDALSVAEYRAQIERLSNREQYLLSLSYQGYNSVEIAQMLDLKASTVRSRLQRIRRKLGA